MKPSAFERSARAHIASRGSPGTRKLYAADLDAWLEHCRTNKHDPDEPTLEAAVAFRDALGERVSASTVRRTLSALSSMYDAYGGANPFKSSKRLPRPSADEVALTPSFSNEEALKIVKRAEEEGEIMRALPGRAHLGLLCYATIIRLLYDTGLRISEVVRMKRDQLRKDGDQYTLLGTVKKRGRVETTLPKSSVRALDKWLARAPESKWVFPSSRGWGVISPSSVRAHLAHLGRELGVKDARPHRFRATFITEALDHLPLHEVQAAVHHSDPSTTQRYDRRARGGGVTSAVAKSREKRSS